MSIWGWLKLTLAVWLFRQALKVTGWLLAAAVAVAAWPITVMAAIGYGAAWLRGWPPARLWRAAAWSLTMTGVYVIGQAIRLGTWPAIVMAPVHDWADGWRPLAAGAIVRAGLLVAPVAVPAGFALGGLWWAWRIYAVTTGLAGHTASAPVWFDERQWRHQVRSARGRAAAPGTVPLLTRRGLVAVGATIRAIGHRWRPVLAVPAGSLTRHSVIIGSSGSGKTNLMMRLWAGWYAATHHAYLRREGDRPLLVVLDCKGGPDARAKAGRTRRLLHGVGARRVAIWPDEARLSLWDLPAQDLGVLLLEMIETGDGAAAFYSDVMQAVVHLALAAPAGPPADAATFLDRLDTAWLESAYSDGAHESAMIRIRAARAHIGDIQLRFATLFARLGPALDGPGTLQDADVWYCILEGTREPSVAETQAMALTELVAHTATDQTGERRAILLAADDYSAVSRRVPISNLYERGRSLGLGVQVSAQSWQGLGASEDERYRIAATADGGIWLLHTPYPEPVIQLAGTRRVLESAHKLIGATWGDEGTTRVQHAWTADPGLIRGLQTGQACYIHHGGATFVQVARPKPSPLSLPPARARSVIVPPPSPLPDPEQTEPEPEPGRGFFDDIFGPRGAR
jgi:hypothetical protein